MKNFESIKELIAYYKSKRMKTENMKKVALYMRYSSKNQTEHSIEYQRRKILEFCCQREYLPVIEYIDEAYSGKMADRPDFQRMLKDSRNKPEWEELMLFNLSRFCRNAWLGIKCFKEIRAEGLEITSVIENFPKTPEGRFMENFYHVFNEYSSEMTATHTREGLTNEALKGLHCGGLPPLGYDVDQLTKQYVINAFEAEAIKMIFDLYEKNYSYQAIADQLNSKGYTTKNGSAFNKNSFDSILKQEKYVGKYTWNKGYAKTASGKRNNRGCKDAGEQVVIENCMPAIISKEQFDRVQEMRKKGKAKVVGVKSKKHYMLGGIDIVKCAECGANMQATTSNSHGRKYEEYFCPNHKKKECSMKPIRAQQLHEFVATILVNELKNRKDIKKILELVNKENVELKVLEDRLKGCDKAIERLSHLYASNPDDKLKARLDRAINEKKSIEEKISNNKSKTTALKIGKLSDICERFKQTLMTSKGDEVREYIKDAVKEVIVDKNEVTVNLNMN